MIEWKPFVIGAEPMPPDGYYLVFCTYPQWNSSWVDTARLDDGMWYRFASEMSDHLRVRNYAEINYPEDE